MGYILGFFAADGSISVNKRGGQFWSIQITDKQLLEDMRMAIGSEHVISVRPQRKNTYKTLYRLQIGSIEMCDDLRRLGYSERKTESLAVPNVPKKYLSDFVRGYFDGDGNVWVGYMHKRRETQTLSVLVGFTSGSKGFLLKLQSVLSEAVSVKGSISKRKGKECWCLRYATQDSLKLFDFMYNGTVPQLFLERKRKVFEKYKEVTMQS